MAGCSDSEFRPSFGTFSQRFLDDIIRVFGDSLQESCDPAVNLVQLNSDAQEASDADAGRNRPFVLVAPLHGDIGAAT